MAKTMNKRVASLPSIWSILPDELNRIQQAYQSYLTSERGEGRGLSGVIDDRFLKKVPETFFIDGGIGVLQIEGVITPKSDIWSFLFGGSTVEVMTRDLKTLLGMDEVKAIVLDIDSPGGNVNGIQEFADMVFAGRETKPIYAISAGVMASAALWIGAAAEEVFITSETVTTGSIGVITKHIDISKLEEMMGIKTTEIVAGKRKRIASEFAPLTREGMEDLQRQVDHVYDAFTGDIARFRGTGIDDVLENMADGRVFVGSQAIEAGLIDEIVSADDLMERVSAQLEDSISTNHFRGGFGMSGAISKTGKKTEEMTAEIMEERYPGVYAQVFGLGGREARDELNAAVADAFEKGRNQGIGEGEIIGAREEVNRIRAVEEQCIPGHEKLIAALKYDGKTTGPEAAAAVIQAEKTRRAKGLTALEKEAPKPVESDHEEELDAADKKDFKALVDRYQAEHKCTRTEAIRAIAKSNPEAHRKYINAA